MTRNEFILWLRVMKLSKAAAGRELGVSSTTITEFVSGSTPISKRTELACIALYCRVGSLKFPWNTVT